MRRKVVQHGPCTLTVSLPAGWTKKQGIARGDHLHVQPRKNSLVVSPTRPHGKGSIHVDLSGKRELATKLIGGLYRSGYDEITVTYDSPELLRHIHEIVRHSCLGFEVVEETDTSVTFGKVSDPSHEFRRMFRRIFFFLDVIAKETAESAQKGDKKTHMRLADRDIHLNRLVHFCERIVAQHGQRQFDNEASITYVIDRLEKIGDLYRDLNLYLAQEGNNLAEEELDLLWRANSFVERFHDLLFTFSLDKCEEFLEAYKGFRSGVPESTQNRTALFYIEGIPLETYNLATHAIMLNL